MPGPIGNGIVVPRGTEDYEEVMSLLKHVVTESDFCQALLDPVELNNLARGDRRFEWEEYQLAYFDIVGDFITNKPRQSGLSFACSAKYFATSQMSSRNFTAIFVSYKKEEAINKINYVKQIMQALPPTFRKTIIRDPLQMIEWENPGNKTRSKIYSHAQKPIRGMTADKILFDEFAFFTMGRIIFESAYPALVQTNGTMDIISTPFGLGGEFYDILTDVKKHKNFTRWHIRWWDCLGYVKETSPEGWAAIRKYIAEHPDMPTGERVYAFGSHRLIKQYEGSHSEQSFRQEFEGEFIDNDAAYFPKELIFESMFNPSSDLEADYGVNETDQFFDYKGNPISAEDALADMNMGVAGKLEQLGIKMVHYDSIFALMQAVQNKEITANLFAGFDVGVTRNNSCLVILEEIVFKDGSTIQVERYREFMEKWPLSKQQDYLHKILASGMIRKMLLDKGGIGWQMADDLEAMFGNMFEGVQLGGTSKVKEKYMTNLKSRMNEKEMALLYSKETIEHLYSIKREVQVNGGITYKADEEKRHHADLAIAVALAALAGTQAGEKPVSMSSAPRDGSSKTTITIINTNARALKVEEQKFKRQGTLKQMLTGDQAIRPAKGLLNHIAKGGMIKPY